MKMKICIVVLTLLVLGCKKNETDSAPIPSEVVTENGVRIEIYDFKNFEKFLKLGEDRVQVVNFWATWCRPCVEELPYFEFLASKYARNNIEVTLVSLDTPEDVRTKLIPFVKKLKLNSRVILLDDPDADAWITKIDKKWSGAIPATLFHNGRKRRFYEQKFTYNELETELRRIL